MGAEPCVSPEDEVWTRRDEERDGMGGAGPQTVTGNARDNRCCCWCRGVARVVVLASLVPDDVESLAV